MMMMRMFLSINSHLRHHHDSHCCREDCFDNENDYEGPSLKVIFFIEGYISICSLHI